MKRVTGLIFLPVLIFIQNMVYAECGALTEMERIKALKNLDWQIRYETLRNLTDCPMEVFTPEIQKTIIGIVGIELKIESKWDKDYKAGKNPPGHGEEYGAYDVTIQEVLFKIKDNPDTIDALLTSMSFSGLNIYNRLISIYGEKLVPGVIRQFNNKDIRSGSKYQYLRLIERLNKLGKLSSQSRFKVRDLVIQGLTADDGMALQRSAIDVAVSLDYHDEEVIKKIEELSGKKMLKRVASEALPVLRANRAKDKSVPKWGVSVSSSDINVPLSGTTTGQAPNAGKNVKLQKSTTVQ